MESIVYFNDRCAVCGTTLGLQKHHVFGGPNRKISEREGLTVMLCRKHHTDSPTGVHHNRALDLELKEAAEVAWIRENDSNIDGFIQIIGKNYI